MNPLLLLVVPFLPFPTRLLGEYIVRDEPERIAVTIYGITCSWRRSLSPRCGVSRCGSG